MRGSIVQRGVNRFAIILDAKDPATGKRKRRWHSFSGTRRAAQIECARLVNELQTGAAVEPNRIMISNFLDHWLDHVAAQLSPRSHERYSEIVRKNIVPLLGSVTLAKLQPIQISAAYAKALAGGRRDGKGGLSASTVVYMHRILKQALTQAVHWKVLARNPADGLKPPKIERKQMKVLDVGGTASLLQAARDTTLYMPILLGVTTGARRGEIAALRWRHVDLDRGRLTVAESAEQTRQGVRYKPPKSGRGRTVALSTGVVEELRAHRAKQAQGLLKLGVRIGDDTFVVAQADGRPLQPRSLTHAFEMFLARHGLPRVRFHDLRHGHATAMLAAGVHAKIVQERLGHSTIGVTIDIYSHVLEGMQEEAAESVDAVLRAALERRQQMVAKR
jgi:integrase